MDIGSNMAENHPVGFQWVMEARLRGARIIHVDPRYTRTSAVSHLHVPIRAGSDIAFVGGLINYILENGRYFEEYVKHYTNAATIVSENFADTEDLDGLFSGWDPESRSYDASTWSYAGMSVSGAAGRRDRSGNVGDQAHGAHGGELSGGMPPRPTRRYSTPAASFSSSKSTFAATRPRWSSRPAA